jgi:hypothetical protein
MATYNQFTHQDRIDFTTWLKLSYWRRAEVENGQVVSLRDPDTPLTKAEVMRTDPLELSLWVNSRQLELGEQLDGVGSAEGRPQSGSKVKTRRAMTLSTLRETGRAGAACQAASVSGAHAVLTAYWFLRFRM